MMEAICPSETSVLIRATLLNIPEDVILHPDMLYADLYLHLLCGLRWHYFFSGEMFEDIWSEQCFSRDPTHSDPHTA
jgi:hypothetical protein